MAERFILVLDEGTASTRAMLFGLDGTPHGTAQRELAQHYPQPGWVEHDAGEIWSRTFECAREMVGKAGGAERIAALGIANQRETVVACDRATGEPLARAIVWQDRRTAESCVALRKAGHEPAVQRATGAARSLLLGDQDALAAGGPTRAARSAGSPSPQPARISPVPRSKRWHTRRTISPKPSPPTARRGGTCGSTAG